MATLPDPIAPAEYDLKRVMIHNEAQLAEAADINFYYHARKREPWLESWKECQRMVLPSRALLLDYYEENTGGSVDGARDFVRRIGTDISDATALINLQILAAGMQSHVITEQDSWFKLGFPSPKAIDVPGARQWLRETAIVLYDALSRSNFYSELAPLVLDAGSVGTATQWFVYDDNTDKAIFKTCHPVQIYCATNARGLVDTVYRVFHMTARQAEQQFGYDNLSPRIKDCENPTQEFMFLHVVAPRKDFEGRHGGLNPRTFSGALIANAPYVSFYKEISMPVVGSTTTGAGAGMPSRSSDFDRILSIGGFRDFPYAVWRWDTDGVSPYGISPTMLAMPTIRSLQYMAEMLFKSAQYYVHPAHMIPSALQGYADLGPGGVNYFDNLDQMITTISRAGGEYPIGVDRENNLRDQQREIYGVDFFLMLSRLEESRRTKTATEVQELQNEKSIVLPGMRRRMGPDFIARVIMWLYHQEARRGRLPAAPEGLRKFIGTRDGRIRIHYTGPLSLIHRRLSAVQGHMRAVQAAIPFLELTPQSVDVLDGDEAFRDYLEESGVPDSWIRTRQKLADLRKVAQQRVEQEAQLDAMEKASRAFKNAQGGPGTAT